MNMSRILLVAAAALVAGCASDGIAGGTDVTPTTTRLVAVAEAPIPRAGASTVTLNVVVTNRLQESVTGGICAQTVEAKPVSGGTWTNVTSSMQACPAIAAILDPGGTLRISASADKAELVAMLDGRTSGVLLRVRHLLVGSTTGERYLVQSNEITVTP